MDFGIFLTSYSAREALMRRLSRIFEPGGPGLKQQGSIRCVGEMHFNPNRSVLSAPIIVACSIRDPHQTLRVGMASRYCPDSSLAHCRGGRDGGPDHRGASSSASDAAATCVRIIPWV